jgi:hypothetical protein
MNARKLSWIGALASMIAATSQAAIIGSFDGVDVQMTDTAYGWICDSSSPNTQPPGDLVMYDGPAGGGGSVIQGYPMSSSWGYSRPDVPAAGFCGSNAHTGFQLVGWFYPDTVYLYYKFPNNTLQQIGTAHNCSSGPGWC